MRRKPLTTTQAIEMATCIEFDISAEALIGPRKTKRHVFPRFAAIKVIRDRTDLSFPQIGRKFGGRDHTTIMQAYERAGQMIRTDPNFRGKYMAIDQAVAEYIEEHSLVPKRLLGHFTSQRSES